MTDRLLQYPSPVDTRSGSSPVVVQVQTALPQVTERVAVRPVVPAPTAHLMVPDADWGWEELRDYVVGQIESVIGLFPRDRMKEKSIFKAFQGRWGVMSPLIVRYAFETMGGYWKGSPVKVNRFCVASDPYFAAQIVNILVRNAE